METGLFAVDRVVDLSSPYLLGKSIEWKRLQIAGTRLLV